MAKKIEEVAIVEEVVVANAIEEVVVVAKKTQIKSIIGAHLMHNGLSIGAGETLIVDEKVAKELIAKKYCVEVKVKEV
ncbi:MAG: hypothetical protein ACRC6E_09390 [Fusobacteriaceae bacterium]